MKYELIDKTGKDFSAELGGINDEKIESGKKIKKDELKEIGFIFNTDADRNYWLADHPEETIRINISVDGTMVATKTNNTEFTLTEKQKVDTVVKKMYGLLGVNESEYNAIEEKTEDKKEGIGVGSGSSHATSSPAPIAKNYHTHLTTHTAVLNAALNPRRYQVNSANNTLEKLNASNAPTGHKITVNNDGSTKGDLFAKLDDTDLVAQLISEDHIAVVNMHLALLKQGIKPDKKINLFLIKQGLTPEQAKLIPEIEEKIKAHLAKEFAKPEYNDIKGYIVYDGVPLTVKKEAAKEEPKAEPEKSSGSAPAEPQREKNFEQKIRTNEDTGNMWIKNNNVIDISIHVLQKYCHDFTRVNPRYDIKLEAIENGKGSIRLSKPYPAYLLLMENNNHFALVWADKENHLHYYNSMSGNAEAKEKELKAKFPGFNSYEVEYSKEQTKENEAWSCGYRVAKKILELESENDAELQKHPLVQAQTTAKIREAFVAEAKDYYKEKFQLTTQDRLFEDGEREDNTKVGKLQYYEISAVQNKPLFNAIATLDPTKLQDGIRQLCTSDAKFRHALIETAPHYIYYNNGNDAELGVSENGLGKNAMGMALMEARNELFLAKDKNHALIVNTKKLREQASKERGEIDSLLGGEDNTEGKSIVELKRMVSAAQRAKADADAGARSPTPRGNK